LDFPRADVFALTMQTGIDTEKPFAAGVFRHFSEFLDSFRKIGQGNPSGGSGVTGKQRNGWPVSVDAFPFLNLVAATGLIFNQVIK
jgi:hypothetical protein